MAFPLQRVPFKFALLGQLAHSPPLGAVHIRMCKYKLCAGVHINGYTYQQTHIDSCLLVPFSSLCSKNDEWSEPFDNFMKTASRS